MWGALILVLGSVILLLYLINLYINGNNKYWPKRGVPVVNFSEVATVLDLLTRKKSIIQMDQGYYEHSKAKGLPYCGIMEFRNPVLMVTDLDLVKSILVKDFDHFVDRRSFKIEGEPVFNEMLIFLSGQKWKDVRSALSPSFTTGKMRRMFECFNKCGKSFVTCVKQQTKENGYKVEVQDVVSRFSIDVIGAAAFGMETNSLSNKDSEFAKNAQALAKITFGRIAKNMMYIWFPKFANFLRLKVMDKQNTDFFLSILKSALKHREQSGENRNDFLQLLVEARQGNLKAEDAELDAFEKEAKIKESSVNKAQLFTDDVTMAQCFIFFFAGFDTVGALVSFGTYLMALYPEIQERVHQEAKSYMDENNGEIDYDSVNKLAYMDMFISEIMRRYPPAHRLERKCIKDYKVPGSDFTIPKDLIVAVSVQGIHMDPDIYPNPDKFDPERFSPENKAKRHSCAYLPFGMGPRNCIGMRFALIESKVALAYIAYNFFVEPTENTPIPVKLDQTAGLNRPVSGLEVKLTPRDH